MKYITVYDDGSVLVHDDHISIEFNTKEVVKKVDCSMLSDQQIEILARSLENQAKS